MPARVSPAGTGIHFPASLPRTRSASTVLAGAFDLSEGSFASRRDRLGKVSRPRSASTAGGVSKATRRSRPDPPLSSPNSGTERAPDGLAGAEIPLLARIVAYCKAFNAMTTDRPYRKTCGYMPRPPSCDPRPVHGSTHERGARSADGRGLGRCHAARATTSGPRASSLRKSSTTSARLVEAAGGVVVLN